MTAHHAPVEGQFKIAPETIAASIAYALSLPNDAVVAELAPIRTAYENLDDDEVARYLPPFRPSNRLDPDNPPYLNKVTSTL